MRAPSPRPPAGRQRRLPEVGALRVAVRAAGAAGSPRWQSAPAGRPRPRSVPAWRAKSAASPCRGSAGRALTSTHPARAPPSRSVTASGPSTVQKRGRGVEGQPSRGLAHLDAVCGPPRSPRLRGHLGMPVSLAVACHRALAVCGSRPAVEGRRTFGWPLMLASPSGPT